VTVDGHDFFAVYDAMRAAVDRARHGGGPTLVEVKLDRFFGHFEGDNQNYRAPDEVKNVREQKDCIRRFARRVTSEHDIAAQELAAIDDEVAKLIDDAVAQALAAPDPLPADLTTDVYIKY
jgi:acetoin:2,6-dichlorophenolindophenol oxidoreductase subunit alpha